MLLDEGRIREFDRYDSQLSYAVYRADFSFYRPATLLRNPASGFYALCKATGKDEFSTLQKMAGV